MGISRDSRHKRRKTGGRMPIHQKKRAYEKARQPSNTKLGQERVHIVRCRGGNKKYRAMRLEHGNAVWASEAISRKTRILDVVYNATNNELVRTQTLTKGTVISIDAHPFQQWYSQHYGIDLGKKKEGDQQEVEKTPEQLEEIKKRQQDRFIDPLVEEQFKSGRLLAKISSRPGQVGRADSYILEGTELEFYKRKLEKKKK